MSQFFTRKRSIRFLAPVFILFLFTGIFLCKYLFTPVENERYHANLLDKLQNAPDFDSFTNALFCYEVTSDSITTAYTLEEPRAFRIPSLSPVLSDFSNAQYAKEHKNGSQKKLLATLLKKLNDFDYQAFDESQKLTYRLLKRNFNLNQKSSDYAYYEMLIGSNSGVQANLPITLSEYPLRCEADIKTYLSLLTQVPDYFENIIAYEKKRSELGYTNPSFLLNETKDGLTKMTQSFHDGSDCLTETFHTRINRLSGLSKKKKEAYREQNRRYIQKYILPAYRSMERYVEQCLQENNRSQKSTPGKEKQNNTKLSESSSRNLGYIPEPDTAYGLASLPKGKDFYSLLVARNTGSPKSVPELIALTEHSLKQTLGSLQQIAVTDPESYLYYVDHPLESYFQSPEAILEALSLMCKANYPNLSKKPEYEIKTVPKSLQESSSPAFYMIPAIDDFKNNTIYINPIYTSTENGNLFTTLAHEGFPGHLYQTVYYNSTSPAPIRQMLDYPGYVEGWATYVEMDSFTYLDYGDKKSLCQLYQYDTLINLALCSRIDLGVNYEGWSLNDVNAFFEENGFQSYYGAGIYSYVVQSPAVYLRYFIGYLEILECKDEYHRLKMENYSEKEFHKAFLEIGPADFETLREELLKSPMK